MGRIGCTLIQLDRTTYTRVVSGVGSRSVGVIYVLPPVRPIRSESVRQSDKVLILFRINPLNTVGQSDNVLILFRIGFTFKID